MEENCLVVFDLLLCFVHYLVEEDIFSMYSSRIISSFSNIYSLFPVVLDCANNFRNLKCADLGIFVFYI